MWYHTTRGGGGVRLALVFLGPHGGKKFTGEGGVAVCDFERYLILVFLDV